MSLAEVTQALNDAVETACRAPGDVALIAVSKVQPDERVDAVLAEGHRLFGENKVQEAAGKWPAFRERYNGIILHLIGPLQTNKARQAMELFDVIQTLDRPKLANIFARLIGEGLDCPDLMIQVNTGAEPQKAGVLPDDADDFIAECRDLGLPIIGVMCIPPADEDPVPHFKLLKDIAERNALHEISMGMSADFEQAVACGATCVRVGSAIFGERDYG